MSLRKTLEELDRAYHDRKVVLVDDDDNEVGVAGLVEAHRDPGKKHRAFSLQLYRKVGGKVELLLQKRAEAKPVFPYYWANTCCYNMAPGEEYLARAASRVKEEMGVNLAAGQLRALYRFSYYAPDIEGWCENELDTVIVGRYDGAVNPDSAEAAEYRWKEWGELKAEITKNPEVYAPWFRMIVMNARFARALGE